MDNAEEPQKKVFKARKTMKASDRQQLEAVHKAKEELLKPTEIKLLNGNHENGDSDINMSHNDTDYMAEPKDLNGILDLPLDSQELPIVKLSDIKDGIRNLDQTRDLKLNLDHKPSESTSCQDKIVEDISDTEVQTPSEQDKVHCDEEKSTMLDTADQSESVEPPLAEPKITCDAEHLEEKSEPIVFEEEEESHIVLEAIHELDDDPLEENIAESKSVPQSIELPIEQQEEKDELSNLEEAVNVEEKKLEDVCGKEELSENKTDNEAELKTPDEQQEAMDANEETEEVLNVKEDKPDMVVDDPEAEESKEMVLSEGDCTEERKEAEMTSVGHDAGEEAISSSMEIDQDLKAIEQKSWETPETTSDKNSSDLQTGPGLESSDSMETDEIIPILEKLAPVEDEQPCFPGTDLQSEDSANLGEEKEETCTTSSPSKQESSEALPSEAFLVLSDEEEPCVEPVPSVEEKPSSPPGASGEIQEEPVEKEEEQKLEHVGKQQAEKSELFRRKRSKSEDLDSESSKRRRFEGEEFEAELKVKITAGDDLNKKLQKVIQKMLEDKLSVLQCAVFDKTLADLKNRVEKIECKKHENVLNTIQAKIARLTKRFGAAKEDLKKRPEPTPPSQQPPSPGKPANDVSTGNNAVTFRNIGTVRQMLESKRNVGEVTTAPSQPSNAGPQSLPSTSLPLRTPNTTQLSVSQAPSNTTSNQVRPPPDWKLIQQRINASAIGAPQNLLNSQSKPSPPVTSASVMTSVIPAPNTATVVGNTPVSGNNTQPMSVSLQSLPVILHVPVAMSSQSQLLQGAAGTLVTNQQSGNVEFIPAQNQSAVGNLNKAPSVSLAQTKPINNSSMTSPGIQRNSPGNASSMPSTLAVQAISTAHSIAQSSRASLPSGGATSTYSQASNRTSLQMKAPQSGFNSPSTVEVQNASRTDMQNRTPAVESASKRAPESTTQGGKPGSGVIDLTLDDEDLETTSQDSRRMSAPSAIGNVQSSQIMSRPPQPQQPNNMQSSVTTTLTSQATIHVMPTAQTTVNINQRPLAPAATRVPAPRLPTNQQIVYTTANLPTVPVQTPVRNTVMQNQSLRQVSPQTGGVSVRMPQTTAYVVNSGMSMGSAGPQLTVHHRPPQEPPRPIHPAPLPDAPQPQRLPPEATSTAPPQKPHLKLARVQSQNGIVLSWSVLEVDRNCANVDSYHLYAYHEDPAATSPSQWKKIGEVKALPLPMACTLTQFVSGSKYYFAVRAKDIYGRFGPFCDPQSTDVISTQSS
ncbi:activating transcription factor 7-interacting protein 1 isoform 1-T4 [Discoglossus pictus]